MPTASKGHMYKGSLASRASTPSSSSRFYKVRKGQFRFRLVLPPSPPKLYIVHSRSFIFAIIHAQRFSFFSLPDARAASTLSWLAEEESGGSGIRAGSSNQGSESYLLRKV